MALPTADGYFLERMDGSQSARPAQLHRWGKHRPSLFELMPIVAPLTVQPERRPALAFAVDIQGYNVSGLPRDTLPQQDWDRVRAEWEQREWKDSTDRRLLDAIEPVTDWDALRTYPDICVVLSLATVVADVGALLMEAVFLTSQRLFWTLNQRVYERESASDPVRPLRLFCVYDELDYSWKGTASSDNIDPETDSVVDITWKFFCALRRLSPAVAARWTDYAIRFCKNLVKNRLVMLQCRGWKGVTVRGLEDQHNERVRAFGDGLPVRCVTRAIGARTKADSLLRPRLESAGFRGAISRQSDSHTRMCPYFFTHTFIQNDPGWCLGVAPRGFSYDQPHAKLRDRIALFYSVAWDLSPFLCTQTRYRLRRALDELATRALGPTFPYIKSLTRFSRSMDTHLFPQAIRRIGSLDQLYYCHFVAPGGLAVVEQPDALLHESLHSGLGPAPTSQLPRLPVQPQPAGAVASETVGASTAKLRTPPSSDGDSDGVDSCVVDRLCRRAVKRMRGVGGPCPAAMESVREHVEQRVREFEAQLEAFVLGVLRDTGSDISEREAADTVSVPIESLMPMAAAFDYDSNDECDTHSTDLPPTTTA